MIRLYKSLIYIVSLLFIHTANAQNYIWAKGEGGLGNDAASAITVDGQGNSFITGNLAGEADFSGTNYVGKGVFDVIVVKYNGSGDVVWVKTGGGTGIDKGNAIKYKNGSLYVAGVFEGTATFETTQITAQGNADIFIAKYDDNGALQWVKTAGGNAADMVTSIDVDGNGNILIAGAYQSAIKVGATTLTTTNLFQESFIAKYDASGNVVWAKTVAGTSTNLLTGIAHAHNGTFFITGFFSGRFRMDSTDVNSSSPSYDIVLAKLNDDGSLVWQKRAGSVAEDAANGVCADNNGNAFITGYFTRTAFFDNNQVDYLDYNDIFIAKYDAQGNNQWVKAGKGGQLDAGQSVAADNNGNVVATGLFEKSVDFSGHVISGQDREVFLVSYDANGNIRWLDKAAGNLTAAGLGVDIKPNGVVALCGYYTHTLVFGTIDIGFANSNDLFVADYNAPFVGINDESSTINASLYPNPVVNGNCFLSLTGETAHTLRVFDVTGKQIMHTQATQNHTIPTANWPQGMYFVQLNRGETMRTFKLVKE